MDIRPLFAIILLVTASVLSSGSFALSSYKADVSATRFGAIDIKLTGSIEFNVTDQAQWNFRLSAQGGPIKSSEIAQGFIKDNQFLPQSYQRDSKIFFVRENLSWEFDWLNDEVNGRLKKEPLYHQGIAELNDPISFQFPMRQALNQGLTQFNYRFLKHKNPSTVAFEVIGEELVTINEKDIHTKIVKQLKPLKKGEQKYLWVASQYDHIPVRYRTFEDDKLKEEINVIRLRVNGKDISR